MTSSSSSGIKKIIREIRNFLVGNLSNADLKLKETEEEIRFFENKTGVFKTGGAAIPLVEIDMSSLHKVQMLPYPSDTRLTSKAMNTPVLEEGCHDLISQTSDKDIDGTLFNNKLKKQAKQVRDDMRDRRTLVITGLRQFCEAVLQDRERCEEHDQDLLQQVLSDVGLDFLFVKVANIRWFVGSGTLKLTYDEAAQCYCNLRQLRKWTGDIRSFEVPPGADQHKLRIVYALKKMKYSFAVPARMKMARKELQKFAMTLKADKKITWFNFQIGKNSEGLILKTYDKYSKKCYYYDQSSQIS